MKHVILQDENEFFNIHPPNVFPILPATESNG